MIYNSGHTNYPNMYHYPLSPHSIPELIEFWFAQPWRVLRNLVRTFHPIRFGSGESALLHGLLNRTQLRSRILSSDVSSAILGLSIIHQLHSKIAEIGLIAMLRNPRQPANHA